MESKCIYQSSCTWKFMYRFAGYYKLIWRIHIVCFSREINFKSLATGSSKLWLYHFLWYIHSNPEDLNSQRPLSVAKVTFYSLLYQTSLVSLKLATYFTRPADCLKLPLSWNWQEMCKNCTIMAYKVIFNVKNWSIFLLLI